MKRLTVALFLCLTATSPALADLSRLAVNVEAPRTPRPAGAIVGLRVQGLSGQAGRITTFGQAFRKGDWPKGTGLAAQSEGRAVPLQYDIKARHDDGSVRHAILSLRNPGGTNDAAIVLTTAPLQPRPPLGIAGLVERGYDLTLTMDIAGQRAMVDAGALLREAVQAGRLEPWIDGPLASEVRVSARLTPSMVAIFDIRALADGAVRTAVSVHHDDMRTTANRDLETTYALRLGGQVVAQQQVKHLRHTNWRSIVWGGAQPSTAHVVFDMPYLVAAGAVPSYDPTVSVENAFYDKLIKIANKGGSGPMASASIMRAMPTTGGRSDIGMVPDWTYAWLRSQSPEMFAVMMANAHAAGSVPWHFRDPGTGRAPTLDTHPKFWADYRANEGKNGHPPIKLHTDRWKLDNAHQPDLSYVPYLVTGDRYHLDELHAQLAFALLSYNPRFRGGAEGNLINDEVRGQAWVNRTHAYAAWITPDNHPDKRYVVDKLTQRLLWYPAEYTRNDKRGGPASYETAGWIQGPHPKGVISNWQQDYFSLAIAQAMQMGIEAARPVYEYTRRYQLSRFLRADFNGRWSTVYRLLHRDKATGVPYKTWAEVARVNIADGRVEANPTEMLGRPDTGWSYTAQARAAYAAMVGAFLDPFMAEAYAFMVRDSMAMHGDLAKNPKWSIVPVFPDGSTLPIANHRAASGRASGTGGNDLLAGSAGGDAFDGGPGNDILAGFDGADSLTTGGGIDLVAGGRGDDRIFATSGRVWAAGGPGRDIFTLGTPAMQLSIADFRPGTDRLSFPPSLGSAQQIMARARSVARGTYIPTGSAGGVMLYGVRADALRADSFAMR